MTKVMGMMSGCYFVGRGELIEWVNNLLKTNYTKIQELSNGAAFCQIIDAIHPGTVHLGRVNFNAKQPFEMTQNYKILQDAFNKNDIKQYVDVVTLTKGKYMAALEMIQWLHGYYQQTEPHNEYDAVARRKATKCAEPNFVEEKPSVHQSGFPTSIPNVPIRTNELPVGQIGSHVVRASRIGKPSCRQSRQSGLNRALKEKNANIVKEQNKENKVHEGIQTEQCEDKQNEEYKSIENELKQENMNLLEKLKKIEELCKGNEENELIQPIIEVLQNQL